MPEFDENGRIILPNEEKSAVVPVKSSWSLFKKKELVKKDKLDEFYSDKKTEDILEIDGDKLNPLKFTSGKTQEDVVNEVLEAVRAGIKIIFVKGACGSGKSAIALNLAKNFKKACVVVPIKSLQDQYEKDYTEKNFILKENKEKLKISVLKGRSNFECLFSKGDKADKTDLPCDIELREKNMNKILEYIDMNEDVKRADFENISDVRRISVASSCPYWSPLLPADAGGKILSKANKRKYMSVSGKEYALFQRGRGCGYYDQYNAYIDADVMIFNSQKYLLETAIGRKPKTDIDIIDECDEFLDNFANEKKLNLNRLITALTSLIPKDDKEKRAIKDLILSANKAIASYHDGLDKLKDSGVLELFTKVLDSPYLAEEDDNNYYNTVFEAVKSFESIVDESYVAFEKVVKDDGQTGLYSYSSAGRETIFANLVTINIGKRFKELVAMNNVFVLLSGTVHSKEVLKDIFGLDNFRIIEAETKNPGYISKVRTGTEMNCKYENMKANPNSRKDYLKALSACVAKAKLPLLVHVSTFADLPNEFEKKTYSLDNLMTKEEFMKYQDDPKLVEKFKRGEIKILFSTKCSRGVDFPGEQCNSIILTKYPYPNIQGIFWRILKQEQPHKFMEFYMDKARRELVQKVARGVRFKDDHVILFSPDSRVLDARLD